MKIVAYTNARHSARCARLDPTPRPCDCDAQQVPLVSLYEAQAEKQVIRNELNAVIEQLKAAVKAAPAAQDLPKQDLSAAILALRSAIAPDGYQWVLLHDPKWSGASCNAGTTEEIHRAVAAMADLPKISAELAKAAEGGE